MSNLDNSRINAFKGEISHATINPKHLIPTFVETVSQLLRAHTLKYGPDAPFRVQTQRGIQIILGQIEKHMVNGDSYYESETADNDLEWLFDTLNFLAPEGTSFGSHEGDGACFGFWENESEE